MRTLFLLSLLATPLVAHDGLRCNSDGSLIRVFDGKLIARYDQAEQCQTAVDHSAGNVICAWFTPGMPIGPGGWAETGWRPMHIPSQVGLGRKAVSQFDDCLQLSASAAGGIVCTYTGLGFKTTHIETNLWCGASSQLAYCIQASQHARDHTVCSFPHGGTGAEAGWVKTHIGSTCDYQGSKMKVQECSESLPEG